MSIFSDDYDTRKSYPIFDGFVMYFPRAMAAVAQVSLLGNQQHNPGEPLHWAKGKSMDQKNTMLRHMIDDAMGVRFGPDGQRTKAQAVWRALADLELDLEAEEKRSKEALFRQALTNVPPEGLVKRGGPAPTDDNGSFEVVGSQACIPHHQV